MLKRVIILMLLSTTLSCANSQFIKNRRIAKAEEESKQKYGWVSYKDESEIVWDSVPTDGCCWPNGDPCLMIGRKKIKQYSTEPIINWMQRQNIFPIKTEEIVIFKPVGRCN